MKHLAVLAFFCLAASPSVAEEAASLPKQVAAAIEAARSSGDEAFLEAVAAAALSQYPQYAEEIATLVAPVVKEIPKGDTEAETIPASEVPGLGAAAADLQERAPKRRFRLPRFEGWEGEGEVKGSTSTGNASNEALGVAFKAEKEAGRYTHILNGAFDFNRSDGETRQERLRLGYQLDFDLSDRTFGFGRLDYEDDRFSGFDYRAFGGLGLGYRVFDRDTLSWTLEASPGVRYSVVTDTEEEQTELSAQGASVFSWDFNDKATLGQETRSTWTEETTTVDSTVSLSTEINSHFGMRLSYNVRYETNPPAGFETTDTQTNASLLVKF